MKKILFPLLLAMLAVSCNKADQKAFNDAVLGGYNIGRFLGFVFWAIIGAYITVQFTANRRDPSSSRTPEKFSWGFWIRDNSRRVAFVMACILTTLRFSQDITGKELNEFWALVIGLSFDLLAIILNNLRLVKLIGLVKTAGKKEGTNV